MKRKKRKIQKQTVMCSGAEHELKRGSSDCEQSQSANTQRRVSDIEIVILVCAYVTTGQNVAYKISQHANAPNYAITPKQRKQHSHTHKNQNKHDKCRDEITPNYTAKAELTGKKNASTQQTPAKQQITVQTRTGTDRCSNMSDKRKYANTAQAHRQTAHKLQSKTSTRLSSQTHM